MPTDEHAHVGQDSAADAAARARDAARDPMPPSLALLFVGLVLCAAVHTRSRIVGAFAALAWCVGATIFAVVQFQERDGDNLVFLKVSAEPWLWFFVVAAVFAFNIGVLLRAARRKLIARRRVLNRA